MVFRRAPTVAWCAPFAAEPLIGDQVGLFRAQPGRPKRSYFARALAICAEANNKIRNASHHGSLVFDQAGQAISYRTGKGGTGEEQRISYADYLVRCVRIFLHAMTLFRIELLIATSLGVRHPI